MATTHRKRIASLCLSAALLALLTPVLFFLHTDFCGTYSPFHVAGFPNLPRLDPLAEDAVPDYSASYARPAHGNAHDPHACMVCQVLLQYISGVTLGRAQEVSVPENAVPRERATTQILPRGNRYPSFFSRAPPRPFHPARS